MATKRIKDLTNTAASVASDAYLAIDGTSNGTEKITRDNFRQDTADAFVAAPGTYNLAPLSGGAVEVAKGGTGATTAAGARTNLSVNSKDEDAQANALKVTAPALYFNGTSSVVTIADDDKFSFTDGTDDLPFSISAFIKMTDATNFTIASKYSSSNEWRFYSNALDDLSLALTDGTNSAFVTTDTDLSGYEGQWIHVGMSYAGAGPSAASGNAFSAAADGMVLYINGVAVPITATSGSYAGMSSTSDHVTIGMHAGQYGKGSIRDVKIFNRELTADEVAELARGNDLGFADEWGGALGSNGVIDGTIGVSSWTGIGGASGVTLNNLTETANTTVGGRPNVLKLEATATSTGETRFFFASGATNYKRIRVEFDCYIDAGNTTIDRVIGLHTGGATVISETTTGAWVRISEEMQVAEGGTSSTLQIKLTDGGSHNATIGDFIAIDNFSITQIGTLADFRAENYDSDTGKIYDISDNAFVGTGTSVSLTGREQPVYETGTWTPSITFGGAAVGVTYTEQEGFYTRIGNIVYFEGSVRLSAKGSSTGALKVEGLPFTARNTSTSNSGVILGSAGNFTGLTSAVTARVDNNATTVTVLYWGSSGTVGVDNSLCTDTTVIGLSGTYQIQ